MKVHPPLPALAEIVFRDEADALESVSDWGRNFLPNLLPTSKKLR